ncbi:MAG: serine protease [Paracoccaceae bacterium]
MTRLFFAVILAIVFNIRGAAAQQDIAWVQIEALPSLTAAEERVRAYAGRLPDVNGFALGGGWYGVVLGPYTGADAERVLNVYRTESEIPRDSFIAYSSAFQQQFWPVGANLLNLPLAGQTTALAQPQQEPQATQPQAGNSQAEQQPAPADETPRQARESEAQLSREDRMQLQVMLQWAGFYDGGIDGAFGRGTRGSMAAWQEANGFEASGILTTLQRAALKKQYNAVLEGLGLQTVADTTAGIEMQMPMGVVAFSKYSPPFVHYDARGDGPARVLLISQEGDQNTLYGLYDIMQTLEIVPEKGERERKGDSFVLTGQNDRIVSYTEAELKGGEIKGFTLIWAAGDEERRQRLLSEMRNSFKRLDGVMSPAEGADEVQKIDLVSGLEIRRPKLSRSGFFVDRNGTVVTTADAVAQCDRITLEDEYEARVVYTDAARGVAVLRAAEPLAPGAVAALRRAIRGCNPRSRCRAIPMAGCWARRR